MIFSRVTFPLQLFICSNGAGSIHRDAGGPNRRGVLLDFAGHELLQIRRRTALGRDRLRADLLEALLHGGRVHRLDGGVSWSFWMTATGVFTGTKKPNQVDASKSRPCSCAVASAGSMGERSRDRFAIGFTSLPSICDGTVPLNVQK